VELFAAIGIGQWVRYLTGLLEISGAIGLFIAPIAALAALQLTAVMIGALATHLFIVGGNPAAAILLFASSLTIAWLRREQFSSMGARIAA
jgi:putative oxidoreductase